MLENKEEKRVNETLYEIQERAAKNREEERIEKLKL